MDEPRALQQNGVREARVDEEVSGSQHSQRRKKHASKDDGRYNLVDTAAQATVLATNVEVEQEAFGEKREGEKQLRRAGRQTYAQSEQVDHSRYQENRVHDNMLQFSQSSELSVLHWGVDKHDEMNLTTVATGYRFECEELLHDHPYERE